MKFYLSLIILCVLSCYGDSWNQVEQKKFKEDCITEGGSILVCDCILECIEQDYTDYEEALKKIQHSNLSEKLKKCLMGCNQ